MLETERLYYGDSLLIEFDARVEAVDVRDHRSLVVLDRTAFYPSSGGQPFDTGTLEGLPVVNVAEREDGAIVHDVEAALSVGQRVHGSIDWRRRFDHMQQHTGQHLLSAVLDRQSAAPTVSFHLGSDSSTIDIGREVAPEAIARAVAEANRLIWENRVVSVKFADAEEAATLPLRKEPARAGLLRLIEIEGCDLSACGGTHVTRTGAIGIMVIPSWERFRGGLRLEFLCGNRVHERFTLLQNAVTASVRVLSVLPEELPAAIERLQAENKEVRRHSKLFQQRLAAHEAHDLVSTVQPSGGRVILVHSMEGWDAEGLKALAVAVAKRPRHLVALLSSSSPFLVVVARSADERMDAAGVLRVLTTRFGGRGGGRPDLAQGGGLEGPLDDILGHSRELLCQQASASSL